MCGIVGSNMASELQVQQATRCLEHRGPDAGRVQAHGKMVLGHRRLSIIDVSERGTQPLCTPDGRWAIVFNGEIYNYQTLKTDLENEGVVFATGTDTEVILHGYVRHGQAFFSRMRGMWACAISDRQSNKLVLSRDQFGIKPLYYAFDGAALHFASELRAFAALGQKLEPHTEAYAVFFNLGYFIAPDTCYRGVKALLPGEVLTFELEVGHCAKNALSLPEQQVSEYGSLDTQLTSLEQVLEQSVQAHFVSDVPVGILFSGGTDSALIAAYAKKLGYDPQAYHLSIEGSIDTEYAKRISAELGLKTEYVSLTDAELETCYERVLAHQDQPFSDMSIIPTSLIYEKIHGSVKVVLSGEGGDEWFSGYRRHRHLARHKKLCRKNQIVSLLHRSYGMSDFHLRMINPVMSRIISWYLRGYGDDVLRAYVKEVRQIDYPISEVTLYSTLIRALDHQTPLPRPTALAPDRFVYLPNDLLLKNDTASMYSSIEARVPFIDTVLYGHLATAIDPVLMLSPEHSDKFLLKTLLKRHVPTELVERKKSGFSFSFKKYAKKQFTADVQSALAFHQKESDTFGLSGYQGLLHPAHADVLITKYPRFAFALVSNYRLVNSSSRAYHP